MARGGLGRRGPRRAGEPGTLFALFGRLRRGVLGGAGPPRILARPSCIIGPQAIIPRVECPRRGEFVMGAACSSGTLFAARLWYQDPRVLWYTAALAGALLLGAIILALVDRWRKKQMNETRTVQDELA